MIEKYILPAVISIAAFFAPLYDFVLLIGFMIVVDCITALLSARKNGEAITSAKLSRTVGKFLVYGLAIMTAHVVSKFFIPSFPALQLMAGFITFIELKSIDENIKKYTGHSMFGVILSKLKPKKNEGQ